MEEIKSAAIFKDGKVYTGLNHALILWEQLLAEPPVSLAGESAIQGFVTDRSRFVDRFEAMKIAQKAGQLKRETHTAWLDSSYLWSADDYEAFRIQRERATFLQTELKKRGLTR